jgi:hypothetical protein
MVYDGSNPLQAKAAQMRVTALIAEKKVFEIKEKAARSLSQNSYLHVILAYFATQVGETLEYVKETYYKRCVNSALFLRVRQDKFTGRQEYLRSSSELTREEMTLSIDRFRSWASQVAGIYLPSPEEKEMVQGAFIEAERAKQYL